MELLTNCYLLQNFFTVMFEAIISYKGFLNGIILFCDEFAYRKWEIFVFWGRASSAVELDMKCTYLGLEVSDSVFFLLDVNSQNSDFLLHIFDLFAILFIFFFQLPKKMVSFFLKILHHQLLLLLSVDYQVLLAIRFDCIGDVVIIVSHSVELKLDLFYILL